jgi:hypothetical protein
MNPKPFMVSNHFTVPFCTSCVERKRGDEVREFLDFVMNGDVVHASDETSSNKRARSVLGAEMLIMLIQVELLGAKRRLQSPLWVMDGCRLEHRRCKTETRVVPQLIGQDFQIFADQRSMPSLVLPRETYLPYLSRKAV